MGLSMGHEAFDRYHETHMQTRWHTQCPSATLFTMACPPSASCIGTILWHLVENPWPTDGLAEIVRSPPAQMVSMRYFHVFSWFHFINVSHKILGDASVALVEIEINWLENSANCSLSRFCFCSDEFTWCFDDPLHGKIMGWHDNEYITKTTVTQGFGDPLSSNLGLVMPYWMIWPRPIQQYTRPRPFWEICPETKHISCWRCVLFLLVIYHYMQYPILRWFIPRCVTQLIMKLT